MCTQKYKLANCQIFEISLCASRNKEYLAKSIIEGMLNETRKIYNFSRNAEEFGNFIDFAKLHKERP